MNSITYTALENKLPLNNFNFLALKITNSIMPSQDMVNTHIVYHGTLHEHPMTCLLWTHSCPPTALILLMCFTGRLDTTVFNFVFTYCNIVFLLYLMSLTSE